MEVNELDKETVIALAKNNMNTTDTANQLGLHRNTVLYRYDRMRNRTGLDARNFYDLCKLVNMATGKDIVEVIRCKDCKFYKDSPMGGKGCQTHFNGRTEFIPKNDNDFCSYGRKKIDEQKDC